MYENKNIDLQNITFEELGEVLEDYFPYIPFEVQLNPTRIKEYVYIENKNILRLHLGNFDVDIYDGSQYVSLSFQKQWEGKSYPITNFEDLIEELKDCISHFDIHKTVQTNIFDFLEDNGELEL